ncbi:MAG TPA: hypothetical protein VEM41_08845 [Actinomycetota bacterium]|nr:hypothetical protein [Actinomycetota bacterium]
MKKTIEQKKRDDLARRRREAQDRPDPLEQGDRVWYRGVGGAVVLTSVNGSIKVRGDDGGEFHVTKASMLHREGPSEDDAELFGEVLSAVEGALHHVAAESSKSLSSLKVKLSWSDGKARVSAHKLEDRLSA